MTSWKEMAPTMGDREEWLLRLLYAPVRGQEATPVSGRTRLMKGTFLLSKKLNSEFGVETDFEFEAEKYGPFDQMVYEAIESLEREGLVDVEERPEYEEDRHSLTDNGETKAEDLFHQIPSDQQELISWIRERHLDRPLPQILSFVYNQYPEMAKNSEYSKV